MVPQYLKTVHKYQRRFRKYHAGSVGMRKEGVLLCTKAAGLRHRYHDAWACSPDTLPQILATCLGPAPLPVSDIKVWLN